MRRKMSKRTYTAEEAGRIVVGLIGDKRPGRRPMSDREFLERYDPERFNREEHTRLLRDVLETLADNQQPEQPRPQWQPRPVPPATPKSGPVNL
jgi:hypothetical protein